MDIIKTNKPNNNVRLAGAALLLSLLVLSGFLLTKPSSSIKVARSDIWISEVEQGDLDVLIKGFGKLKPKYQRLLTAPKEAIVEEILHKPGAIVSADTVLLRLSNAGIEQDVANTALDIQRQQSGIRELIVKQQSEVLSYQANLAQLEAQWEEAELKVEAETTLAEKGILSQLDFKRSLLTARQLGKRLAIERQRLQQLETAQQEQRTIEQDRIKQLEGQLQHQQLLQQRLTVVAGIDGVLQRMRVELGQSVTTGAELALIGSTRELIAELQVAQNQAQNIQVGDPAVIDTRGGKALGKVIRIDPVVRDGSVLVEVDLPATHDNLPDNARPDLSIEGEISVDELKSVLYMRRPAGVDADSSGTLFMLDDRLTRAQNKRVRFGVIAGAYIQISEGAALGDRFIGSDTSRWQEQQELFIAN